MNKSWWGRSAARQRPFFAFANCPVRCTNGAGVGLCSLTLDTERKVGYKCSCKDVDGEEYISTAAGQRVGQKVLRVRSSWRDGMVPRVARVKSNESSPSRSRHRYQGREYHLQMTASQDRTRKVRLAYRTCSHHRTGFFVEASSLKVGGTTGVY